MAVSSCALFRPWAEPSGSNHSQAYSTNVITPIGEQVLCGRSNTPHKQQERRGPKLYSAKKKKASKPPKSKLPYYSIEERYQHEIKLLQVPVSHGAESGHLEEFHVDEITSEIVDNPLPMPLYSPIEEEACEENDLSEPFSCLRWLPNC